MCEFFSCVSDGTGKMFYFDAEMRRKIINGETPYQDTDSHTSIAHYHGVRGRDEDTLNKYEYNMLTGKFKVDKLNSTDDSAAVEEFCRNMDWTTIAPELIVKPIIHPFQIDAGEVNEEIVALARKWANVRANVRASVRDSVWDSEGAGVWASVCDSVWDSLWDILWNRVWDSVWDSVWAYIGSFFRLDKWKYVSHEPGSYPFQAAVGLWERGFVPAFDGKTWRLHAGPAAAVVYEWKQEAISEK